MNGPGEQLWIEAWIWWLVACSLEDAPDDVRVGVQRCQFFECAGDRGVPAVQRRPVPVGVVPSPALRSLVDAFGGNGACYGQPP